MNRVLVLSLTVLMILYGMPLTAGAQETSQIFSLPEGSVGKSYRANIEAVLRDNYGMRLQSEARVPLFRWAFASGEIPPGLVLRPNGTILGTPRVPRETPYQFKLKVSEAIAPMSVGLLVEFNLTINASHVKLVPANTVKLVPAGESVNVSEKRDWTSNRDANHASPLPLTNLRAIPDQKTPYFLGTNMADVKASFTKETNTNLSDVVRNTTYNAELGSISPLVSAGPAADCSLLCNPTPAPDEKKDFIIDVFPPVTSRGRTRFDKRDRARIFIINKNPFLYDYRITLEDKPVEEPALAAFLKLLGPIGEGTFDKPKVPEEQTENARAATEARIRASVSLPCPDLKTLLDLEKDLSSREGELKTKLKRLTKSFNDTNAEYKSAQDILTSPTVRCPQLCAEAAGLQTNLNNYLTNSKNDVESFEEDVSTFREKARSLKTLATFVATTSSDCATEVSNARLIELADYYTEAGTKLKSKLDELISGRKVFSDTAKSIKTILSTENAFNSVFEKGDFDGPTDVLVKVERKSKVNGNNENKAKTEEGNKEKEDGEFSTIKEAKLNFGGGPRFALAAGFVFSPLEKPEYQRVPAVINGQNDHIVGLKENSNSRILPILILHSRLFSRPNWKYVSGVHMSLGLTAQPNNEGTDPEFLVGPSISFIEERLFFTFGGYAGRKQELEGNLTLGQKIPEGFGDELPVSKHYVWKPGFAITYKVK